MWSHVYRLSVFLCELTTTRIIHNYTDNPILNLIGYSHFDLHNMLSKRLPKFLTLWFSFLSYFSTDLCQISNSTTVLFIYHDMHSYTVEPPPSGLYFMKTSLHLIQIHSDIHSVSNFHKTCKLLPVCLQTKQSYTAYIEF